MRRRLFALFAALCLAASVLAGCATIPDESQAQPVANPPTGDSGQAINGPTPNVDQYTLVRSFLTANAEARNDFQVPRSFLTADAKQRWQPTTQVTVVANHVDTTVSSTVRNDSNQQNVQVRGINLGTLAPDGSFSPAQQRQPYVQDVTVERDPGQQWRIKYVENGLVIQLADFQRAYQQVSLNFSEPKLRAPIPDVRYYPRAATTTIATQIVNGLISGPSTALQGAVVNNFDTLDRRRPANVAQTGPDVLTVDLPPLGNASQAQKRGMIDQIVRSLRGVVGGQVVVQSEGQPLDPDKPAYEFSDLPTYGVFLPAQKAEPLYVQGALLKSLALNDTSGAPTDDGKQIEAMTGISDCPAVTGARSLDGDELALVCRSQNGRLHLRTGQFGKDVREVANLEAGSFTRPTWAPGSPAAGTRYEVWTVADGRAIKRLHKDGGTWTASDVNADQLFNSGVIGRGSGITQLRMSRDGVRVAIVADGKLIMCSVLRDDNGEAHLSAPTVITNGLDHVRDVDWMSQTEMVVVYGSDSDTIATVSVDGLYSNPLQTTNMTPPVTNIAAAPGQPFLAVASGSTFTSVLGGGSWIPRGDLGRGVVPFYAG